MVDSLWLMVDSLWFLVDSLWFLVDSLWFLVPTSSLGSAAEGCAGAYFFDRANIYFIASIWFNHIVFLIFSGIYFYSFAGANLKESGIKYVVVLWKKEIGIC